MEDEPVGRPWRQSPVFLDRVALRKPASLHYQIAKRKSWKALNRTEFGPVVIGRFIHQPAVNLWPGPVIEECETERAAELRAREMLVAKEVEDEEEDD